MVYSVSIPAFKPGKPVLYEVHVDLGSGIQPYILPRRYSDFLKLAQDVETEMGEPVTVAPPPKPGLFGSVDCEARRMQLETMLVALVRVPDFADSMAVSTFLEVFSHRRAKKPQKSAVDWVHTTTEISRLTNEARNASQGPLIRQRAVQAKTLVGQLQRNLNAEGKQYGAGELARRQQQLDNYLFALRQVERQGWDPVVSGLPGPEPEPAGRVLGETADTRKLNNRGLLQSQQTAMDDQDEMIEGLRAAVSRQKQLGMAIHTEITKQNEMLETLDEDVHRVNARLNQARRKTAELR